MAKKASVKRLYVKDPYNLLSAYPYGFGRNPTVATFAPETENFSSNTNPAFDPSKAPGAVTVKQRAPKPIGAATGHMKAIPPNRFTMFGGKTLRRR